MDGNEFIGYKSLGLLILLLMFYSEKLALAYIQSISNEKENN